MALTDIQLFTACMDFTLHHTHESEQQTFKELETSGATRLVNGLAPLSTSTRPFLLSACSRCLRLCCNPN
ncbi:MULTISPECIES: hypothetical protein [unclassified Bradyrhizobium]|uniref:hypothetical protein n=1 Tax=unclassified Bradyrhizobium TaxID=2631580 RepID=UPI001FFA8206|nr:MULTISPECIES: hypothetical protein [unclassified Bradyrhizobium]MCK1304154.1 hypothetical protein [Bradyrhizobium sp. 45]MCK1315851.1 hypothetical protein [Bradyrhizobium sp. 23]MCK1439903.1 hypothetical protein [Bradyrhizobium sp. 15]MCK1504661.1 hypothetical protein [Bradyrhizobium sp. 18]MCK1609160.1 hypothetical protein [Bradyrhizobium sp. 163]